MKKVLELFGEPISFGGQESIVTSIVSHMNRNGLHIDFLTPYYCDNDFHRKTVADCGGKIYQFGLSFDPHNFSLEFMKPVRRFLKTHHYDVVHIHSGTTPYLGLAARIAKKAGVKKVIVHSHASVETIQLTTKVIRRVSSLVMRYADVYVACSKEASLAKYVPDVQDKVVIIYNGIDLDVFKHSVVNRAKTRIRLGIAQNAPVIVQVGRISSEKNQLFTLEVFKDFVVTKKDAVMLFVGVGPLLDELKAKVSEMGLQNHVKFVGAVDNVAHYTDCADVAIVPSLFEGFGIVAVEAQALGLPVVASDRVPVSVQATGMVEFVSLNAPVTKWSSKLLSAFENKNRHKKKTLKNTEFDITYTAQRVRELYLQGD